MTEQELRLECLKLAVAYGSTLDRFDPVAKADAYLAYVTTARPTGGEPTQTSTPSPVSEGPDTDGHPWRVTSSRLYHGPTDAMLPIILTPDGDGIAPHELQAELDRLHFAPAEATRKERERCIEVLRGMRRHSGAMESPTLAHAITMLGGVP